MMRVRTLCAVLAALVTAAATVHAQLAEPTLRVMERLLRSAGDEICAGAGDSAARFTVSNHPDAAWIATQLLDPSSRRQCLSQIVDSSSLAQITVVCRDVQTTYTNSAHPDTVIRSIIVDLAAIERSASNRFHAVRKTDTILVARTDVATLDSRQHMASHGSLPQRPTSMWEEIAQPVVFIAAAVITVVLLFTVRSQ